MADRPRDPNPKSVLDRGGGGSLAGLMSCGRVYQACGYFRVARDQSARCFVYQLLKCLKDPLSFPYLLDRNVGIRGIKNDGLALILCNVVPNLRASHAWVAFTILKFVI